MFVHQIEADDTLSWVNDAWLDFARQNHALHLTRETVLEQSLWDFITEATTQHFYKIIVGRVRNLRRVLELRYRCDSPAKRRYMRMEVRPLDQGRIQFCNWILREEIRPALELLASPAQTGGSLVVMCSWCKKVQEPAALQWLETEEAVNHLNLFQCTVPPQITHGICPECEKMLEAELATLE